MGGHRCSRNWRTYHGRTSGENLYLINQPELIGAQILWRAMGERLVDMSTLITTTQSEDLMLTINKKPADSSSLSFEIIVSGLTTDDAKFTGIYQALSSGNEHRWRGFFAAFKSTALEQVLAPPKSIPEDVSKFLALIPMVDTQLADGGVGTEDKAQIWANNIFEEVSATLQST